MKLYGRMKRLKEIEEAEAQGESFWTEALDEPARYKLLYAFVDLCDGMTGQQPISLAGGERIDLVRLSRREVMKDLGLQNLAGHQSPSEDTTYTIMTGDEDRVFSLLQAALIVAVGARERFYPDVSEYEITLLRARIPQYLDTIKTVLREHRLKFDLVDGHFVPFESREMYEAVVSPVLTLLGGRNEFAGAEKAYREALDEISDGTPDDAITDAGTALQEALTALGCEGKNLKRLAASGLKKGLLAPYDSKIVAWVEADRSNKGDAHNSDAAARDDAWLVVHVVGAFILRLASDSLRGNSA